MFEKKSWFVTGLMYNALLVFKKVGIQLPQWKTEEIKINLSKVTHIYSLSSVVVWNSGFFHRGFNIYTVSK